MEHKDVFVLETIRDYCDRIFAELQAFNIDEQTFYANPYLQDMLAFAVIQIGENANDLSDGFVTSHPEIEWAKIVGFRNNIVHDYGDFIPEILWSAVQTKIPELREFCVAQIG